MNKNILDNVSFEEIQEFLDNDAITDIDWNGRELWINDLEQGRYLDSKKLSKTFINDFAIQLANAMRVSFNQHNQVLEAETNNLRISIIHESVTNSGRSFCIRKTPTFKRINRNTMLETKYCTEEVCNFMENAIKIHCSIIICGLPNVGKTEYLKALTEYIPAHERAITIEDSFEIHYKEINPGKDCVELKIGKDFGFEKTISTSVRHDSRWLLLSEVRDKSVRDLMNALSTGNWCMTTIHSDDVRKIPDRMASMVPDGYTNEGFITNIYQNIDIGVLISSQENPGERVIRKIEQICLFNRDTQTNNNTISMIYENGVLNKNALTNEMLYKFRQKDIVNPFRKGGYHTCGSHIQEKSKNLGIV